MINLNQKSLYSIHSKGTQFPAKDVRELSTITVGGEMLRNGTNFHAPHLECTETFCGPPLNGWNIFVALPKCTVIS